MSQRKFCELQDVEPLVDKSAAQNNGEVDLSAAFDELKEQHPKMKVSFAKFRDLANQIISRKQYRIKSNKVVKPPPLLPRVPVPSSSQEFAAKKASPSPDFEPSTPTCNFNDIGGLDSQKDAIGRLVLLSLQHSEMFERAGDVPMRGILLHGPSGCGKTLLAEATAGQFAEHNLTFFKIHATDFMPAAKAYNGQAEGKLRALFKAAAASSPALVVIDDVDIVAQKKDKASSRMVAQFAQSLDECFANTDSIVIVIGVTSHLDNVDASLRRPGRFSREIAIGVPDYEQRLAILRVRASRLNLDSDVSLEQVAREAEGFVGADIRGLCQEAACNAVERALRDQLDDVFVSQEDFIDAVSKVHPTLRREGFATLPPASFADIGGLEAVKAELQAAVIEGIIRPDIFAMYGHRPSSGILLYGPPGCGKTLLARALAHEANRAAFISVKGPELLNKYLGESESAVRGVFRRARDSAPCIIFFDELDALCPRRSEDSSNAAASRVVNQLLTEMDGAVDRGRVFVIGATNRPGLIDEAMLRPGRLDKKIEVPKPNLEGRIDILQKQISRIKNREEIDCASIAKQCEDFSGADLEALTSEAIEAAIAESREPNWVPVGQRHFEAALVKLEESKQKVHESNTASRAQSDLL